MESRGAPSSCRGQSRNPGLERRGFKPLSTFERLFTLLRGACCADVAVTVGPVSPSRRGGSAAEKEARNRGLWPVPCLLRRDHTSRWASLL